MHTAMTVAANSVDAHESPGRQSLEDIWGWCHQQPQIMSGAALDDVRGPGLVSRPALDDVQGPGLVSGAALDAVRGPGLVSGSLG